VHAPLDVPGADAVAEGGEHHHQPARDGLEATLHVDAEQHRHAGDADRDPGQARPRGALLALEREREQEREDRSGCDQDAGERRGDVALAGRDQQQRAAHLDHGEHQDRPAVDEQTAKRAGAGGDRQQHQRGQRGADADDQGRRHVVLERDLDEQVGAAPEGRQHAQQQP
jgi:hypothetical protein